MKKLTQKEFIERSIKFHGNKYDYSLINYTNSYTKVDIICKIHGVFKQTPSSHIRFGCNLCSQKLNSIKSCEITKTTKDIFIKNATKVHNDKYDYNLVKYINTETKVEIICKKHGSFFQTPHHHLKGSQCPNCSFNKKLNTITFIEKAKIIHNNLYNYNDTKFVNCKLKVKIICAKHGEFNQIASDHLNGCGCPICKKSKGEKQIRYFLENQKIEFITQMKFDDCKNKTFLLFDFYIKNKNTCIEFDGLQHFKPIKYFGGVKNFEKIIKRDEIKNEYCKNNNIRLIRIKYDENVKEKLSELLNI